MITKRLFRFYAHLICYFGFCVVSSNLQGIDNPFSSISIRNIRRSAHSNHFLSFTRDKTNSLKPCSFFCKSISDRHILIKSDSLVFFLYRKKLHYITSQQCYTVNRVFTTKFKGHIYRIGEDHILDVAGDIFSKMIRNKAQLYHLSAYYGPFDFHTDQEISRAFSSLRPWKKKPWKTPKLVTIRKQSSWIYQRDCLIEPCYCDVSSSQTNLQRMQGGRAPISSIDGLPINLHHVHQTPDGPLAEVTSTFHTHHEVLTYGNVGVIPSLINRDKFRQWRKAYWKIRYEDFVEKRVL